MDENRRVPQSKDETRNSESGFSLIFVLLIVLVIIGGILFALDELLNPNCQKSLKGCFDFARKADAQLSEKKAEEQDKKNEAKPQSPSTTKTQPVGREEKNVGIRNGLANLHFTFGSLLNGNQVLYVDFDKGTIGGPLQLSSDHFNSSAKIRGTVDQETGDIQATLSGTSTTSVSQGTLSGSATTEYSGTFIGTIDGIGIASGTLVLTTKIVSVTGNIPGYTAGKTDTGTIPWSGNAVNVF